MSTLAATERQWLAQANGSLVAASLAPQPLEFKAVALMQAEQPTPHEELICSNIKAKLAEHGIEVACPLIRHA
jgi:hypothetical protein